MYAAVVRPAPRASAAAASDSVAPMPWAKRLGGPGTGRGATGSRGVITRVTSCPRGLSVGPVRTRARNPYAITAVSHGCSSTIASALINTTPAATRRADTSLTGSGKVKSDVSLIKSIDLV